MSKSTIFFILYSFLISRFSLFLKSCKTPFTLYVYPIIHLSYLNIYHYIVSYSFLHFMISHHKLSLSSVTIDWIKLITVPNIPTLETVSVLHSPSCRLVYINTTYFNREKFYLTMNKKTLGILISFCLIWCTSRYIWFGNFIFL